MRRFTLFLSLLVAFVTTTMAQSIDLTFTKVSATDATVAVAGNEIAVDGVTATIAANYDWKALNANSQKFPNASILCPDKNTNAMTAGTGAEGIFTITLNNLPAGYSYKNVTFTSVALNGAGEFQGDDVNAQPVNFELTAAGEVVGTVENKPIKVNSNGGESVVVNFEVAEAYPATDGSLELKLKLATTESKGCFYGLIKVSIEAVEEEIPALPTYTVTAEAQDPTMGTATVEVVDGVATFKAVPNEGYKFVDWLLDGEYTGLGAEFVIEVSQNIALVAVFEAIAVEPEPTTEYAHHEGTNRHAGRALTTFTIANLDTEATLTVSDIQVVNAKSPIYVDKTENVFEVEPGNTIYFEQFGFAGEWMHAYAYIDYNNDCVFGTDLNIDGDTEGELVSHNFYSATDAEYGTTSRGQSVKNGNANNTNSYEGSQGLPHFTLPADLAAGDYRLRIKTDWNNLDPNFVGHTEQNNPENIGACQVDIILRVAGEPEPEVPAVKWYRLKETSRNEYMNVASFDPSYEHDAYGMVNIAPYAESNNQIFTMEDAGDGKVYLRTNNNYYLTCGAWNVNVSPDAKEALIFEETTIDGATAYFIHASSQAAKGFKIGGVNMGDGTYSDDYYVYCDAPKANWAYWVLEEATLVEETPEPEQPIDFDWTGIFDVTASVTNAMPDLWSCPETFTLKAEYNQDWEMITITEVMGKDIFYLTNGGWKLTVAEDKRSAEISFFSFPYGRIEKYDDYGEIVLRNADTSKNTITLTVNNEGVVSVENLSIGYAAVEGANWMWQMEVASLTNVTATKGVEVEPTPQYLEVVSVSPVDKAVVNSLDYIQLNFAEEEKASYVGTLNPVVLDKDNNVVATLNYGFINPQGDYLEYNEVALIFSKPITTPGTYTVKVPAGAIYNNYTKLEIQEIVLTYTVEEATEPEPEPVTEYAHHEGTNRHAGRALTTFTIADVDSDASLTVSDIQVVNAKSPIYVDKTDNVFEVKAGSTLYFEQFGFAGEWMHAYAYIDYNNDFVFGTDLNIDGDTEGELVSHNFYSATDAEWGTTSRGQEVKNGNANNTNSYEGSQGLPHFTLPADLAAGDYRLRIKTDWNNLDPNFVGHTEQNNPENIGACQVDIIIRIVAGDEPVTPPAKEYVALVSETTLTVATLDAVVLVFDRWVQENTQSVEVKDADGNVVTTAAFGWKKPDGTTCGDTELVLTLAEAITAAGTYTITLPENSVWDYVNGVAETTITITVDPTTGINGVEAEGEQVIYDITGRRIEKINAAGVYIVNGVKVLVK